MIMIQNQHNFNQKQFNHWPYGIIAIGDYSNTKSSILISFENKISCRKLLFFTSGDLPPFFVGEACLLHRYQLYFSLIWKASK